MFDVRNVHVYSLLFIIVGLMGAPSHAFANSTETLLIGIVSLDKILVDNAPNVVANVVAGSQGQDGFHATLLYDVYTDRHSIIYNIANGQILSRMVVDKVDVGSAEALAAFVNDARSTHRPQREILTLIGHGVTPIPDIGWNSVPDAQINIEHQPSAGYELLKPLVIWLTPVVDQFNEEEIVQDYDFLSTPEMGDFLSLATDNGQDPFDILFFDRCFDGSLDALYEVKDAAEVFIASPNYAWAAYPYDQFVPAMTAGTTNTAIAEQIITDYDEVLDSEHPNSIFWIERDDIDYLARHVGQLGVMLKYALEENFISTNQIKALQSQFRYVDTDMNSDLDAPDEYATLHSLATAVNILETETADVGGSTISMIRYFAHNILTRLETISSRYHSGHPHLFPEAEWTFNGNDTITVLAPLDRDHVDPTSIWRSYLYADPTVELRINDEHDDDYVTGVVTQTFKFAQEYAWDDFIAHWYVDSVDEDERVTEINIEPWIQSASNTVSESLFDFENDTRWRYHYSFVGSSSIVENAMQIEYREMQLGETVAFKSPDLTVQDWNRFDTLSISVEGTNSGNDIQIYINDKVSGRYIYIAQDDFVGWKTLTIPLSEAGLILDIDERHEKGQAFNLAQVYRMGIEMRTRNENALTGSIRVDDIRLIGDGTSNTLFDFDNSTRGWKHHYTSIGSANVVEGALHINYKNLSPSHYIAYHSDPVPISEWGAYQTLSFSVQGSNSGNEVMMYLDSDTTGWSEYWFTDDSDRLRKIEVPLEAFSSADPRPNDIYRIGFEIKNDLDQITTGTLQIDDIMLNK